MKTKDDEKLLDVYISLGERIEKLIQQQELCEWSDRTRLFKKQKALGLLRGEIEARLGE